MYSVSMTTCKECGIECLSGNSISFHLKKLHAMTYGDYLIKHEHNGVQPRCSCGKMIRYKAGGFTSFCSRSCATTGENNAMGRLKGKNSPNFGQKRTPKQRINYSTGAKKRWELHGDMLRKMMKTPEYRTANSASQREGNQRDPNRVIKRVAAVKRFWSSDTELTHRRRREASDRAIALLEENKIGPHAPFKTQWCDNPFTGKEEFMHSSWETAFLSACITEGYPVTKEHGIRIPYVGTDGFEHAYVPDFVSLGGDQTLFEVKGHRDETDDLKERAARAWCDANGYEFVVIGTQAT